MLSKREGVCIAGATGYLGSAIVTEFCTRKNNVATNEDDDNVVAIARNSASENIDKFRKQGVKVIFVDGSHKDSDYGPDCFENVSTAISCLASIEDFWAIDRDATIRFGLQAIRHGVQHLVLIATFEGKDSRHVTEFSNAKEQAVDVLQDECNKHGTLLTVIRPNAYFKDLTDMPFDRIWKGTNSHIVLGDGSYRINPVAREDVAVFIADCVQNKLAGEFPVGGPDVFSFREIGVLAATIIYEEDDTNGLHPLRVHAIPLWSLRLVAIILYVFTSISQSARRLVAILNWMIYCSTHDAIAPCCGKRHLKDEYKEKLKAYKRKQQQEQR